MGLTTAGWNALAARTAADTVAPFFYMAVGTNDAAESVDQTALGAEVYRAVATAVQGGTGQEHIMNYSLTVTGANLGVPSPNTTVTISEVGIFNAAVRGTMLARFVLQPYQFYSGAQDIAVQVAVVIGI